MIARLPDRRESLRGWLPLMTGGGVYALVICVVAGIRADPASTSDFRDFWETARHFRLTGEISTEFGVHNYLPFFTIFMTPWSLLPLRVAAVVFTLLSLALFGLTVVLTETLLNGRLGPRPRKATLAAILLMLAYVHSCAVLGQLGLLLLFLVVTTWFLVEREKDWAAGVALGLATLIKLLPGVLIVFFLLKLRWRVAAAAMGVIVVLGLGLPLAGIGLEQTVAQHRGFVDRAVGDHAARTTILADKPIKAKYSNNSLPIVLRRLLSPVNGDPSDSEPDRRLYVNIANVPPPAIWRSYIGLMAVFVGMSVIASLRHSKPWPPTDPDAGSALRAQFAIWCCLMLIAAPLLWTHYLPLAYWPLALVTDRGERVDRETSRPCPLSLIAMLTWLACAVLLAWPAARAAGAQLLSVVILWTIAVLYLTLPARGAPESPQHTASSR
jgi:hypothetical protein